MKFILMIALVCVIMLVAQGISKQYKEKYALYDALGEFFRQMRLNVSFQKQKINEILNNATLKKYNKDIYTAYLNYLEKGENLDLSCVRILDEREVEQIQNMLLSLGKNDTSGELQQLEAYEVYLHDKIENSRREKEKFCPLITKLSFLFAIGLAILFI